MSLSTKQHFSCLEFFAALTNNKIHGINHFRETDSHSDRQKAKVKNVSPSHYRPGQAQGLQEFEAPRIPRQLAYDRNKVVRLTRRPFLPLSKDTWYSFRLETESIPGPQRFRKD